MNEAESANTTNKDNEPPKGRKPEEAPASPGSEISNFAADPYNPTKHRRTKHLLPRNLFIDSMSRNVVEFFPVIDWIM